MQRAGVPVDLKRGPVIRIRLRTLNAQHGASQRLLGDVFDLPHSRISAIIKEFREKPAR